MTGADAWRSANICTDSGSITPSAQLHAPKQNAGPPPPSGAHILGRPVLIGTLAAGNHKNTGRKKSGLFQPKVNADCHATLIWLSSDSGRSAGCWWRGYSWRGGQQMAWADAIWQPAGHSLDIQRTTAPPTSEDEKRHLETAWMSWGD